MSIVHGSVFTGLYSKSALTLFTHQVNDLRTSDGILVHLHRWLICSDGLCTDRDSRDQGMVDVEVDWKRVSGFLHTDIGTII